MERGFVWEPVVNDEKEEPEEEPEPELAEESEEDTFEIEIGRAHV